MTSSQHKCPSWPGRLLWVVVFAVAFAWVESAVVIYLREIFFDGGFRFPLLIIRDGGQRVVSPLVRVEVGREIATIVVLAAAGWLAGRSRLQRFWLFMVAFGVWDIFYYVWLRVLSGWPPDLMTWDLLFYVPLPWVGPVITPVLIALVMTVFGTLIVWLDENDQPPDFRLRDILSLVAGGLLLIVSFCWDWKNILQLPARAGSGVPETFAWWLYLPALCGVVAVLGIRVWAALSALKERRAMLSVL